jgi:hypothetical protein
MNPETEMTSTMETEPITVRPTTLPRSCLGPDGKLPLESEEERRNRLESVRKRLAEIEQMTEEDPPGAFEEFMRGLDEGRPHRPMFKGYYEAGGSSSCWIRVLWDSLADVPGLRCQTVAEVGSTICWHEESM